MIIKTCFGAAFCLVWYLKNNGYERLQPVETLVEPGIAD